MKLTIDGVEIEVDDSCEVKVAGKQVSIRAKPVPTHYWWYYPYGWPVVYPNVYPYYPYTGPYTVTAGQTFSNLSTDAGNTCYTITSGNTSAS